MRFVQLDYRPGWAILLAWLAILMVIFGACTKSPAPPQAQGPKNDAPVIHYLRVQKQVAPAETLRITCAVVDKNDDILSYDWSTSGGQVQGRGDKVVWTAPSTTGSYTITVVVSDGKGGKATSSATILVTDKPNRSPVVSSVTCQDCTNGTQASRWKTYSIRCDASDPEGSNLSYQWSATMGKINGEGRLAIWTTLSQYGYAVIKVIVTDDKGNEAEGYLSANISCCN